MRPPWIIVLTFSGMAAACASSQPQLTVPSIPVEPHKQNVGSAEFLFDEGIALKEAGKYAEAIPKFEASYRLDPTMGTLYELADCYERIGRVASAWGAFTELVTMAKHAGMPEHEQDARVRAEQLKPRLPKLTIVVPENVASVPGIQVRRNDSTVGRLVWNKPIPVDPGEHTLVVTAPSRHERRERVAIGESESKTLSVQELDSLPMSRQRVIALGVGGVGVVGVVVGSIFGGVAISQWNDALSTCRVENAEDCTWSGHSDTRPEAERLRRDAEGSATVSTWTFVAGSAALAAAAVIWFTGPVSDEAQARTGWHIVPVLNSSGGGASLGRAF